MRRTILTITLAALFALGIASTARADNPCSLATLTGGYGLTLLGSLQPNNAEPVALVGRVVFDGNGNFSIVENRSINGAISQVTVTGTYTMNTNCTGVITVGSGGLAANYNFVVDTVGAHIRGITATTGQTTTFDATKQFIGQ